MRRTLPCLSKTAVLSTCVRCSEHVPENLSGRCFSTWRASVCLHVLRSSPLRLARRTQHLPAWSGRLATLTKSKRPTLLPRRLHPPPCLFTCLCDDNNGSRQRVGQTWQPTQDPLPPNPRLPTFLRRLEHTVIGSSLPLCICQRPSLFMNSTTQ